MQRHPPTQLEFRVQLMIFIATTYVGVDDPSSTVCVVQLQGVFVQTGIG